MTEQDSALRSATQFFEQRIVERIIVPLAFLGVVYLVVVVCRALFGEDVARGMGGAVFVVGALAVFTPMGTVLADYIKFDILKRDGDPLKRRNERK